MAEITREQAIAECDALVERATAARCGRDREAEVEALVACIAHPCAAHELHPPELWSELANAYRAQRRFDEAIDAWEQVIAVGYRSLPHPRADIAEILLEANRRTEAGASSRRSVRSARTTSGSTTRQVSPTHMPATTRRRCIGSMRESSWRYAPTTQKTFSTS
jgi:hypothetical protein